MFCSCYTRKGDQCNPTASVEFAETGRNTREGDKKRLKDPVDKKEREEMGWRHNSRRPESNPKDAVRERERKKREALPDIHTVNDAVG